MGRFRAASNRQAQFRIGIIRRTQTDQPDPLPPAPPGSQFHRVLGKLPNGHLHIALSLVLVVVALAGIVSPIRRSGPAAAATVPDPAAATDVAVASLLQGQAEGVAALLDHGATGEPVASSANAQPLRRVVSNLIPGGSSGAPAPSPVLNIPLHQEPATFTVHENGFTSTRVSTEETVAEALTEVGVHLNPSDIVDPPTTAGLESGMHVYVDYATRFTLAIGGTETEVYTQSTVVRDALAEQGIALEPADVVSPGPAARVKQGMTVSLEMVRDAPELVDEPIPFETEFVYDDELPDGERVVEQYGLDGNVHREYAIRRVNGVETSREVVSEEFVWPVSEIVAIGTYVEPTPAPAPPPVYVAGAPVDCVSTVNAWATWYTAASAGGNTTATGTGVYKGIIAVDPSVIPLGTRMYVPGYGYGVAADTGGGVKGHVIDLGYGPGDVYDWSSRYLDICILP
jgi:3D (Asp-Asp-Asp) domain-containing protein